MLAVLALPWAMAQSSGAGVGWTHLPAAPAAKAGTVRWVQPDKAAWFRLDRAALNGRLRSAVQADPFAAVRLGTEIDLPMPDGTTARFRVVDAPVMAPELAAKFPEIKTYAGQGMDDPEATVRLDLTPEGLHAQVLSPKGAVYVDPAFRGDAELHVSYFKHDYRKSTGFRCFTAGRNSIGGGGGTETGLAGRTVFQGTLRTYRLAVAATGEYSAIFGGTVSNAMSAIVTAVNRVDGVYETELAVRLVLIANDDLIVYTDAATDPYTNDNPSLLLDENQSNLDAVIGSGNYDVGHVFSTAGGGLAALGVVCVSGFKAQGETGTPDPVGDAFYIDYVAHEMGHQFGANHTFNTESGSCSGNREPSVAYEPGSGSTIMAYAGICPPDDLQLHSDPYFHAGSLNEIHTYLTAGGGDSCAVTTTTTNLAPIVNPGPGYAIPANTPFVLTASATDPNGDPVTYCWEEMDLGPATMLTDPDNGSSPLFRSFSPTNVGVRYFPKLSSVLANTNWDEEIVPIQSRTMHLRVTVRDNRSGGGGVADGDTTVQVVGAAGPFVVTSPNTAVSWSGVQTVTWDVAGTTNSPINAGGVNIYLSADGGASFAYLLATNVPNTGSATVVMPNIGTSQARIKVQAAGNIFYDISDANFTVTPVASVPLVQLAGTALVGESCMPTNGNIDPYETVTVNWTLINVGSVATTNLTATLLTNNSILSASGSQDFGAIAPQSTVTRTFTFVPAGVCGGSATGALQLADGAAPMGLAAQTFALGQQVSQVSTQLFANAAGITIVDASPASPYPSTILVSGVTNTITGVRVSLNGFAHTFPSDVGILLAGPGGQTVVLMDACGGSAAVSGLTLTFDDSATSPVSGTLLTSGTFLPTDLGGDVFDFPAPSGSYGTSLSALAASPNGSWSLYVEDFSGGDDGNITGGWTLQLMASNSLPVCCATFPAPTFTSTSYSNSVARFAWSAILGPHYQVQYRTNLAVGSWQNFGGAIPGTNTVLSITDLVTNGPMRFYRVVVGP